MWSHLLQTVVLAAFTTPHAFAALINPITILDPTPVTKFTLQPVTTLRPITAIGTLPITLLPVTFTRPFTPISPITILQPVTSTTTSTSSTTSTTSKPSSNSTTSKTSTPPPSSTSSQPAATQSLWGQCAGTGYTGPTTCAPGLICVFYNEFYSQCQNPATASSSTPKPTSTSTSTRPPASTASSTNPLDGTRTTDILASITGFYDLPSQSVVIQDARLNISNIQGDILIGMRKQKELFLFFNILSIASFKSQFRRYVLPRITTTYQLLNVNTQPMVALNVGFAQRGLQKLGINDDLIDNPFKTGQWQDRYNLGDLGNDWVYTFRDIVIDGVFLIASDDDNLIASMRSFLMGVLPISSMYELEGNIRPPPFYGHEMFGYLDGVGQPGVAGFNINPVPGQQIINAGVILAGQVGDVFAPKRPSWMYEGSFLVFRQIQQLVPEFDKYLLDNAPPFFGADQQANADLLGARMIGRWKSGAPIDISPYADDINLALDTNRNNDFDFSHPNEDINSDETRCPFAAHIRKTRPRADEDTPLNAIMRAGIPYGPELTDSEIENQVSSQDPALERGLAFVAYQSSIQNGFQFMTNRWVNTPDFPPGKAYTPGFDPIVGEHGTDPTYMTGADPNDPNFTLEFLDKFVINRGGEYFFSPSINALATRITT